MTANSTQPTFRYTKSITPGQAWDVWHDGRFIGCIYKHVYWYPSFHWKSGRLGDDVFQTRQQVSEALWEFAQRNAAMIAAKNEAIQ